MLNDRRFGSIVVAQALGEWSHCAVRGWAMVVDACCILDHAA